MKRMQKLAFLCLLSCPLTLFAAQANISNVPSVQQGQDAQKNQENQNLNISSDMLGLKGPFSLSTMYSKTFGLILEGKYTQLLNSTNALALELDGGRAERRIGATWGYALTSNQLIKLTAENLSQKMDFDFDSGNVSKWVYQNAIGGSYEYLLPYQLLKDINLNAYYSKANSQDLGSKDFTKSGMLFRNYRRIAGATDKSASAGIDISPLKSTLIGLQLNYDNVKYDMHYQKVAKQNDAGLGATISLHQLVNDKLQFSLLASDRKPYKDYQAEVDWLLNSAPGSQLQLGLVGERIDANFGLPNDDRVGLQLSYSWGGDSTSSSAVFNNPVPSNDVNGLKDWTNTPAVHMAQVLAIKDQKTEQVNSEAKAPLKNAANESGDFHYNQEVYHDLPITPDPIHVGTGEVHFEFGNQADKPPLFVNNYDTLYDMQISRDQDIQGLPQSLTLTLTKWGDGHGNYLIKIDGTPTQADFDKSSDRCIHIQITAHRLLGGDPKDTAIATIEIKPVIVAPTIDMHATSYTVNAGESIDRFDLATVTANQETVDPDAIKLDPDLSSHGIYLDPSYKTDCKGKTSCEIYLKADKVKNVMDKTQIKLNAGNTFTGQASAPFDVTIDSPKNPKINLHTTSYQVNEGGSINHSDLATITANEGTIDSDTIKLDPDLSSHGINLDPSYKTDCKGKTSCEIYLQADKITNTMDKTQVQLNVGNTGGGSDKASFDMTINDVHPDIQPLANAVFNNGDTSKASTEVVKIIAKAGSFKDASSIKVIAEQAGKDLSYYNLASDITLTDNNTIAHIKIKIKDGEAVQYPDISSYTVTATNTEGGVSSLNHAFTITVNTDAQAPIIQTTDRAYKEGYVIPSTDVDIVALVFPGEGEMFLHSFQDITIEPVNGGRPLSDFNVHYVPWPRRDLPGTFKVTLQSESGGVKVPGTEKSCLQMYKVIATSVDKATKTISKITVGYFTLTATK